MPNTRSASKMMRVAERRRLRNRAVKSSVKTFLRKAERGITSTADDLSALVVQAIRSLDKAASKGVLHRRNAARRKSRLMKKFNATISQPVEVVEEKPTRRKSTKSTTRASSSKTTRAAGTRSRTAAKKS